MEQPITTKNVGQPCVICGQAADAQATIAALQARVQELEEITKVICGHCCEPMEIPSKAVLQSALTQRTAEFQRNDGELQQICGQALGYPWFKDDQKNFPGATEKDGVCVGEHVGITIAQELANAYRKRTAELEVVSNFIGVKYDAESRTFVSGQAPYQSAGTTKQEACIAAVDALRLACATWETKYRDLQAELERVRAAPPGDGGVDGRHITI